MKIAICLRTWGEKGGIGGYTRNLLNELIPLGVDHQFILLYQDDSHVGQFGQYGNVREIYVPARTRGIWDQVAAPYHAMKEGADVIFHTKFSVPLFTRRKTVMVLHGSERFVYPQFSYRSDILFFRTIYPLYLRRASAIISVSENARQDVIRFLNLNPEKVKTIHLAASECFRKIDDAAVLETVRTKYHLPERFILNVGLIYPGKNIPNLLRALQQIRKHEDVKLVIAGSGRRMYKKELAQVRELGLEDAVLCPGYVPHDDLVAVYNLAAVFAFPSFYEGFGIPILEAMACGCPVVTSKTGSGPEVAGEAGLLVEPRHVKDISDGILEVLTNDALRQDLITKGFQQAQHFSWEKTARATLQVLEEIV
jgi:glycosyltransferase involved in cell wall biosynthesis